MQFQSPQWASECMGPILLFRLFGSDKVAHARWVNLISSLH